MTERCGGGVPVGREGVVPAGWSRQLAPRRREGKCRAVVHDACAGRVVVLNDGSGAVADPYKWDKKVIQIARLESRRTTLTPRCAECRIVL
jgi:hypothetical protein